MFRILVCHVVLVTLFVSVVVEDARCADIPSKESVEFDDASDVETAKKMFARGERLFDEGAYMDAAAAFQRAHDLAPHPAALVNVGYSYEYAREHVRAIAIYNKYLAMDCKKDPKTIADVRSRLAMLKMLVGEIHISCHPGDCNVEVDGVQKGRTVNGKTVVLMTPGNYTVTVSGDKQQMVNRQYRVEAGAVTNARFSVAGVHGPLVSAESVQRTTSSKGNESHTPEAIDGTLPWDTTGPKWSSSGLRISFYSLLGAAMASFVVTAIYGVKTMNAKSDYTDSDYTDAALRDKTLHNKKMTNIFIGVTSLLAAGAVTMKIIDNRLRRRNARRLHVSLDVRSTIGVQGRF
ncbi:MAG: hypothetical protein JXR76_25810 [Deltaproteobacteria bacterium]|nr:hypothetical protein [Deltaproteobacteria bacterium]